MTAQLNAWARIQTTQKTIVLDPGHGGDDPGLVSPLGKKEKTITLELARITAKLLEGRYNVLLTRPEDKNLSDTDRVFVANKNQADLFVAIHLNAAARPLAFGYYFDTHNATLSQSGIDNFSWQSRPLQHKPDSQKALHAFSKILTAQSPRLEFHFTGAPVLLLEGTSMPGILIEPFSIYNLPQTEREMTLLMDQYARLISDSIALFFK